MGGLRKEGGRGWMREEGGGGWMRKEGGGWVDDEGGRNVGG